MQLIIKWMMAIVALVIIVLVLALLFIVRHNSTIVEHPIVYSADKSSAANNLAASFLEAMKYEESGDSFVTALSAYPIEKLHSDLQSEGQKMAFWLNVYNAYTQYLAVKNPEMIENSKIAFFTDNLINIAGEPLGLDVIENGIIRHSKHKLGMGYIPKFKVSAFEKKFRMNETDWRIHFCLNCGAASCPPILFYTPEEIDSQLEIAAKGYLSSDTKYDESKNIVHVTQLTLWFKGDFGGNPGIRSILKNYELIPTDSKPTIKYNPYDWTIALSEFAKQSNPSP